jgi:predicted ATPase/DNA-binding SARP family transcriptional activator
MESTLQIRLFGKFAIEKNREPVAFKRRKSEALAAYLALHEGVHSREKIASLFWGDSSDEDARRTLRVVLADVRKILGDAALPAERDTLTLDSTFITELDVRTFALLLRDLSTASTSELLSALELYRGDLLEGFYDDWVIPLRETYRSKALSALHILTERARADGDYLRAVEFAERSLLLDPFNETALQHLIVSLAAGGDKERAIKRFKDFEKQSPLEISKETQALFRQIQKQGASTSARLSNLPRPLTSFIGREDELNEIETLLAKQRLVTLLGAGGSGKTRLAIQAADEIAHNYEGGVWWVDFSSLTEAELVPQVIAKSLGVREKVDRTFIQSVVEFIGGQKMLILLDNCEQVLRTCAQSVAAMLMDCPQLTVLATSREPLGVDGEIDWQVPVFPLPEAGANLKTLTRNEAARLFLERGRNANPSFGLTEANAEHVINICRRLDGIPLALELAATLLRSMPVEDVSKRLDRQFESLHMRDDVRPLRQQTLHALIDWSYNLLTPAEQIFFRRLGVFAGGWSFETAMIVAGGYGDESLQAHSASVDQLLPLPISATDIVYGLLDSLKRRSLISITHADGMTRYRMLETLREYALERCVENNEHDALNARHLKEILRLANEMEDQLSSGIANQVEIIKRFDPEVDNVRAALGWALREGNLEDGMLLGATVYRFWSVRQMYSEISDWLEKLCFHPRGQTPTRGRGYALTRYALSLRNDPQRRFTPAITEEAVQIFTSLKDVEGIAHAKFADGEVRLNYSDVDNAEAPLLHALEYFRANPKNVQTLTAILSALARIQLGRKQFEQAYAYINESLEISEASHASLATGWNLLVLGDIAFHLNDLPLAAQHYERSLEIYLPLNRLGNLAYLQEALAAVAFARGDILNALKWVEESLASYDSYGGHSTFSRSYRAAIAQMQGDLETARLWLQRAIENKADMEQEYRAMYLLRLADYAAAQTLTDSAVTLYAFVLRLAPRPGMILFPPEIAAAQAGLDTVRASLPPAEVQAAVDRAGSITFDEAIQLIFPS